jgi:hypothetical protein
MGRGQELGVDESLAHAEAEAALGLPDGVHSYAILPIGYPLGRFGPVRRVALADVVYEDRWGQAFLG